MKTVYNALIHNKNPSYQIHDLESPEYIYKEGINGKNGNKMVTKIPHNKPNLLLWDCNEKICQVVEFSSPADTNVSRESEEKVAA